MATRNFFPSFICLTMCLRSTARPSRAYDFSNFVRCGDWGKLQMDKNTHQPAVLDAAFADASGTVLRVLLEGSRSIAEHYLDGQFIRQISLDSPSAVSEYVAIAPRQRGFHLLDSEKVIRSLESPSPWIGLSAVAATIPLRATRKITGIRGLAYSTSTGAFYFAGIKSAYTGPFIVDAETGVAAEPDRRRDSAVAGIITSMHVSDANRTLFMLEAGEGVIYRYDLEKVAAGASPERAAVLSNISSTGRRHSRRMLLSEAPAVARKPAGMAIRDDGKLLTIVSRDGHISHFCADPEGEPTRSDRSAAQTTMPEPDAASTEGPEGTDPMQEKNAKDPLPIGAIISGFQHLTHGGTPEPQPSAVERASGKGTSGPAQSSSRDTLGSLVGILTGGYRPTDGVPASGSGRQESGLQTGSAPTPDQAPAFVSNPSYGDIPLPGRP
uniref:Uncharacterized protein n=1 Tax=Tetraselmis sp. GSL018 TaxID=582737 RepID=A0A061QMA9_9CHLO|mmetsp:Transcript_29770/g.70991  ORF Transcript_29770/g.70991 Transcript_29770/m.70991 type:complete len:439 (-) Transcript_29770:370-1686(-)